MLFVLGAASLRPRRCKQNSRDIFSTPFGSVLQVFAKSVYEPNFASFLVISTLIFLTVLDLFHFLLGGYLIKKGVCILDFLYRINHFHSKWLVKYLVLFGRRCDNA